MFTDKFLELPFITYDGKSQKITGADLSDVETLIQIRKIDITEIEAYEQAIPATHGFDESNIIATEILMRSGNSYVIDMPMDKFEKEVNKFYEASLNSR